MQAVEDVLNDPHAQPGFLHLYPKDSAKYHAASARQFLNGDNWLFKQYCFLLDVDPTAGQESIEKMIRNLPRRPNIDKRHARRKAPKIHIYPKNIRKGKLILCNVASVVIQLHRLLRADRRRRLMRLEDAVNAYVVLSALLRMSTNRSHHAIRMSRSARNEG